MPNKGIARQYGYALTRISLTVAEIASSTWVDGARMPNADQLPGSLASLARRQALELNPNRFGSDFQRLLPVLDRTITTAQQQGRQQAEEVAARRRRQIEQLQGQLRERAAVQDWEAVMAVSEKLAELNPAAGNPDDLASTAREQITRRQQTEEARRYRQIEETQQKRRERDAAQHRRRIEKQEPNRRKSDMSTAWIWVVAAVATTLVTVVGLAFLR
jgi:hypothetical protein